MRSRFVIALFLLSASAVLAQGREGGKSNVCQQWPGRPECGPYSERYGTGPQTPWGPNFRGRQGPARGSGSARPGAPGPAARQSSRPAVGGACTKAQGTIKGYLVSPGSPADPRALEVCDTKQDFRIEGAIVVVPDATAPSFAQTALDDLGVIASIDDPSESIGFQFLRSAIDGLRDASATGRISTSAAGIVIRHGGVPSQSKPGRFSPFTRPGTGGQVPTDAEWRAATAETLDVYGGDGTPVGGNLRRFTGGLSKGTGTGIGSSIFYRPEDFPNEQICPSGLTGNVALMHELQHAARMAWGRVDNTPFGTALWNADPLAGEYGVHEEQFVVERENRYRAALRAKDPGRYPNLRLRKNYLQDC